MSGGDGGAADRGDGERRWRSSFPDGEGSDPFLRRFKEAVAPGDWLRVLRKDVLPVVVLETTGRDVADTSQRAKRVLDGLEDLLIQSGREDGYDGTRVTPYTRPAAPAKKLQLGDHLVLKAGEELRAHIPHRAARLPYRHLRLMVDLTEQIRKDPEKPVPGGRALRDHVYGLRADGAKGARTAVDTQNGENAENAGAGEGAQDTKGGVFYHLQRFSKVQFTGPLGGLSDLLTLFGTSLLYNFPRWCWSAWWTRKLLRSKHNWYEQWRRIGKTDESVFEKVSQFLTRQSERLGRDNKAAEAARQDIEELLVRALLADLHEARPGRFGPKARRRRTRRVVLLDLPSAEAPSAALTSRFLRAYTNAAGSPGAASLLVIGAGTAAASHGQDWRRCQNLRHGTESFAAVQAEAAARPLLVPLTHQGFDGEGIYVTSVEPWTLRPDIRLGTEITVEVAACAVALAAVAALVPGPEPVPDDSCFDGTPVAGTGAPKKLTEHATEKNTARKQYDSVVERIDELNAAAVASERKKDESTRSTVRKVVYLGATVPSDPEEAIDNGAVPELRGLLLAQERLNADAVDDSQNRVRLYVDVRDTGNKFENVVRHAERVAKEAKRFKDSKDHRTIVGVVGFSESREQTQKAAAVLDEGQVPVIGTTATADAMQWNPEQHKRLTYYRPMAPSNSRESQTAAAFARKERVVDDRNGHCEVAAHAMVIAETEDLFSSEMSKKFADRFGPGAETLPLANSGEGGGIPPVSIAKTVCARVKQEPRTIVYWAARVRNFSAFVNAYGPDSGCGGLPQKLTVLGSNELTSTALRGKYKEPWLRLYHSVHVLPQKHPDNNGQAERLFQDYVDAYTAEDPWLNDGHVALAHDALKVLSTATDDAFSSTGTAHTELVKSKLDEEIVFQGASGVIDFPELHGSKPPPDKALTILHVTPKGPEVALHCGAFKENEPPVSRWGPKGEHKCPTDG